MNEDTEHGCKYNITHVSAMDIQREQKSYIVLDNNNRINYF